MNEKRFRKKTKDGKTGPWMERKLECKVGAIDSHVFGYCLRNSPNKALYHHTHPAHGQTKRQQSALSLVSLRTAGLC